MRSARYAAAVAAMLCVGAVGVPDSTPAVAATAARWTMGGHDLANSRSNPFERSIGPSNVGNLALDWTMTTAGDVSATPAVVNGALYVPDWGGMFWKADAATGRVLWSHSVADYVGIAGAVSRTSPAVVGDTVYIGTQQGASLLAIDTATGHLRWKTQLDSHPAALLTQSPVVFSGLIYEGVSSREEILAIDPTYPCCTFRGSLAAVEATTGRVVWQTPTIPYQGDSADIFSGASVWGGTPTVDPRTGSVYVTTGNNYDIPKSAQECQAAGCTPAQCLPSWDRVNSIIAFDAKSGAIKWSTGQDRFDVWNGA
jgi:polyvinyl alcohol dehydrogenase (cytochrome)